MEVTITTPALLFPAISVLFLAYANRYLAIAKRTRELHSLYNKTQSFFAKKQVESLRKRISLIIAMQLLAVMGIICCVLTMGLVFFGLQLMATYAFLIGMLLIVLSLLVSMWELMISTQSLNIELENIESA
ncbi:MAG: DUF2721 domain-containing protein [Methylococcaceae bacterium]|nr:DUF2721 domain-containing protein [Methylococcaceae bacterium]